MNSTTTNAAVDLQTARSAVRSAEASMPPEPSTQFQRLTAQYIQALPRRDRGRLSLVAIILVGIAACAFLAWFVTALTTPLALGVGCLLGALVTAHLLSPARVEALITQIEREHQRLQETYAAECSAAVKTSIPNLIEALKVDAVGAVQAGRRFQEVRERLGRLADELGLETGQHVACLDGLREQLALSKEETGRLRERLTATWSGLMSRILPLYRKQAMAVLHSIKEMHEHACKCERLEASVKVLQALCNEARRLLMDLNSVLNLDLSKHQMEDQVGSAMGGPLPTRNELQDQARQRMDRNLTERRSRVLLNLLNGSSPVASVEQAVEVEFAENPAWPRSVADYVSGLGGNLGSFAEVFWLEANEQLPVRTKPGKIRFRVALLIGPSSTSPCFQAIAGRCRDVATIGSTEHCPEELLAMPVEVNLTIDEVPELASIIKEFRSLPVESQRRLITATPFVDELLNWLPERSVRVNDTDGLLDLAVAMEIVKRDGSGQVLFGDELIAKGYSAARLVLAENPDLSARVSLAVRTKRDTLGSSEVRRLLLKAKDECPVPAGETDQFCERLDDEIGRLSFPEARLAA